EDEQLGARTFYIPMADPERDAVYLAPGLPFRGEAGPLRAGSRLAPAAGADTEAVLAEWSADRRPPTADGGDAEGARVAQGAPSRRYGWVTPGGRWSAAGGPLSGVHVAA